MSYKSSLRSVCWVVVFHLDHFTNTQETKLLRIFEEKLKHARAVFEYEMAKFGTCHLTWRLEVGYDFVHSWCTEAFRELKFTV